MTAAQQRAGAVTGVDLVDVGAAVEQRGRGFEVSLARGVQQRRHAALGGDRRVDLFGIEIADVRIDRRVGIARRNLAGAHDLAARFDRGRNLARRRLGLRVLADEAFDHLALFFGGGAIERAELRDVDHLGGDRRIGAAREQRLDGLGAIQARRENQRRLAGFGFLGVDVGLGVGQQVITSALPDEAARCSGVTPLLVVARVDVGAGLDQRLRHGGAARTGPARCSGVYWPMRVTAPMLAPA